MSGLSGPRPAAPVGAPGRTLRSAAATLRLAPLTSAVPVFAPLALVLSWACTAGLTKVAEGVVMRQAELNLTDKDRSVVDDRCKGVHPSREINQAEALSSLDRGVPETHRVTALACSAPPAGRLRWTMVELERSARQQHGIATVSLETLRRVPRKNDLKPWRGLMW